jgi:hypothetical protein
MSEVPDTVQQLLGNRESNFTRALELVSKVAYNQPTCTKEFPRGFFGDAIHREIYEFGQAVGVDYSRELLKEAALQQKLFHESLARVCERVAKDLDSDKPGSFSPMGPNPVE